MTAIVIYGAGGHGRETALLLTQMNAARDANDRWSLLGFIDDDPSRAGQVVWDLPVLGDGRWLARHPDVQVALGLGDPAGKRRVLTAIGTARLPVLAHPQVTIPPRVRIGAGTQIHAGTILTTDIVIGRAVTINRRVDLSHDNVIGDCATLAPSVSLAGAVHIGEEAQLGIRATCIPGVRIGARAVIGAGAVIIHDVPADVTAVGVPARLLPRIESHANAPVSAHRVPFTSFDHV